MKRIFSVAVILCFVSTVLFADSLMEKAFAKGNVAFAEGRFQQAIDAYRSILDSDESANLHYNLGTAYAKTENYPAAAYHFLEALRLDPHHQGAQANLKLISEELDSKEPLPSLSSPANLLPFNIWIIGAAISGWAFLISFAFLLHPSGKFPGNKLSVFVSAGVFALTAFTSSQSYQFQKWTLVSQPDAVLRLAPTKDSPGQAYLTAGSPVKRIAQVKGFYLVETQSDQQGYLAVSECFPLSKTD